MYYVLDEDKSVKKTTSEEWIKFIGKRDKCRVALDNVGPYEISTVFIGLDKGPDNTMYKDPLPLVFETMITNKGEENVKVFRYSGWYEAQRGHKSFVRICTKKLEEEE